MAWMPGVRHRPISRNFTDRVTSKDCILLHSTGTNVAVSQYGWFNTPGAQASSHFHVDFDGNIEQYIDSAHASWANSAANPRSVTIETQGNGYGPWTAAQVRSIVRIIQWARSVHRGIPLRQMTSSARNQKGIGWHRLGCDGNFPHTGILRGRLQRGGGQVWSKAYGKICPGDDRIKQIPAIIRQANGHATPATASTTTKKASWFDMASLNDLKKAIAETPIEVTRGGKKTTRELGTLIANLDTHAVPKEHIADAVLDARIPVQRGGGTSNLRLGTLIAGQDAAHNRFAGDLAALREIVDQLAAGEGVEIDYEKVEAAAARGVERAIQELGDK